VILLDTQVLIWLAISPERISPAAAAAIQQAGSMGESPQISAVSLYEVANAIRRAASTGNADSRIPRSPEEQIHGDSCVGKDRYTRWRTFRALHGDHGSHDCRTASWKNALSLHPTAKSAPRMLQGAVVTAITRAFANFRAHQ